MEYGGAWADFYELTPHAASFCTAARHQRAINNEIIGAYQGEAFARMKRVGPVSNYLVGPKPKRDVDMSKVLHGLGISGAELEEMAKAEAEYRRSLGEQDGV